jgi:hypothetical protein
MADRSNLVIDESISDNDVSLDSSSSEQEEEYNVEEILAERPSDDSSPRFLVRWENYPDERYDFNILIAPPPFTVLWIPSHLHADPSTSRCTWEPAESFLDPQSLHDWAKKRATGGALSDDLVNNIDAKINTYLDAQAHRRAQTQIKRRRLAARSSNSSTKPIKTPVPATTSHRRKGKAETSSRASISNIQSPESAQNRTSLVASMESNPSKLGHNHPGSANQTLQAKPPVFHGISLSATKKSGQSARRTGNQRASATGSFRNLRHMNNVRKIARRERSPDVTKLQLRSLADWVESAPEDTNLQLPPLSASSASQGESGGLASIGEHHPPTTTAFAMQPPTRPSNDIVPSKRSTYAFENTTSSTPTSNRDMKARNRVDSSEMQGRKLRTLTNGRFFYFPGEVLVDLKFGKIPIGDVRIAGLPAWVYAPIIRLKSGHKVELEIGPNDVVTLSQWAQLCTGRSNLLHPTGVIIPFQDTAPTVSEMERYLHQHTLAALWYHPTEDFMLVFYSPHSAAWTFLGRKGGLPSDGNMRVLTRNKMPPTAMLAVSDEASAESQVLAVAEGPRRFLTQRSPSAPNNDTAGDGILTNELMTENNNVSSPSLLGAQPLSTPSGVTDRISASKDQSLNLENSRSRVDRQPSSGNMRTLEDDPHDSALLPSHGIDLRTSGPHVSEAGQGAFHLHLEPGQVIGDAFQKQFHISYKYLTAVPASKHVDSNAAKARFYLCYPRTAQAELECLRKFLRSYTYHTNICTSMEERGWDAFRNIYKSDYIGVVLVCC